MEQRDSSIQSSVLPAVFFSHMCKEFEYCSLWDIKNQHMNISVNYFYGTDPS
jgi:hypothetical protein